MSRSLLVLLLAIAGPMQAQDFHADIRPLLIDKCLGCHSDAGVAFSMEDPEQAYALGPALAAAVAARRMPPWLAEPGHQRYADDLSLTPEQIRLFADWAAGGFARGEPRPDPVARRASSTFTADLSLDVLPAGQSYLPVQSRKDDYRCFVMDWPLDKPAFVTGFRGVPGNPRVAHHLVLFAIEPALAERFRALDKAEEGNGYQCFGGAVPDRLGEKAARAEYEAAHPDGVRELHLGNYWLAHWAPGMDGYRFPHGTGMSIAPGAVLVAQMHYYAAFAPGERDAGSRMEFQIAEQVDKPAFYLPLTNYGWLDPRRPNAMSIEPGQRATYETSAKLDKFLKYVARVTKVPADEIAAMEIHSANLHMHRFGASGVVALTDGDGRRETLLSIPRWDLAWQRDFTFVEPKRVARDAFGSTRLSVQCTFDNPEAGPVRGGYGSDDEMCFDFSYIAVERGATADPTGATGAP